MDLDLDALQYEPLADRPSKVGLHHLGRVAQSNPSIDDWIDALPQQLAGNGFRRLRDAVISAHAGGRKVVAAMGGHVIKTGCAPYLIDWVERGVLSGLAMNGSAAIHDLELAIAGRTSEDVGPRLIAGTFGFARETSELFAEACDRAAADGLGLGRALGEVIAEHGGPGLESSVLVAAYRRGIPLTVHVAVGTDIVHMTPQLDGAALGRATCWRTSTRPLPDRRHTGGRSLASRPRAQQVVLPEVFLKAVAIARNLGHSLDGLTTANLDFHQQYRGLLRRPPAAGRRGSCANGPPRADDPPAPRGGRRRRPARDGGNTRQRPTLLGMPRRRPHPPHVRAVR